MSQLRAAKKGQEIDVWVKGRTKIRIRVGTSPFSYSFLLFPTLVDQTDDTDPGTSTAVLLNADTEVYVAPRPRGVKSKAKEESTTLNPPTSYIKGKEKAGCLKRFEVRLVPGRVASRWGTPPETYQATVLYCSEDVLERARRRFGDTRGDINVKAVLNKETSVQDPAGEAEAKTDAESEESKETTLETSLVRWDELPDGCAVVIGEAGEEWKAWSRIRLIWCSPSYLLLITVYCREARQGGANLATSLVPQCEPSAGDKAYSRPAPKPHSLLAGTTKLVDDALGYLKRAAVSPFTRPLLLTGAKGSGKTSLARILGEKLESDRDILTGDLKFEMFTQI